MQILSKRHMNMNVLWYSVFRCMVVYVVKSFWKLKKRQENRGSDVTQFSWPILYSHIIQSNWIRSHSMLQRVIVFSHYSIKLDKNSLCYRGLLNHHIIYGWGVDEESLSLAIFTKKHRLMGIGNPIITYKPGMVWRPSQVYNGDPYTNKMGSSWWIEAPV